MDRNEFQVPEDFMVFLDQHEAKQASAAARAQTQRKHARAKEKRRRETRAKNALRDLEYARIIFGWVADFRQSAAGQRAFNGLPVTYRPDKLLNFFTWRPSGWGYSLDILAESIRWYRYGPGAVSVYCDTPEKLAESAQDAPAGMLKAACDAIENGDVWTYIKMDLALFSNKIVR